METGTVVMIVPVILGLLLAAKRLGLPAAYEGPFAVAVGLAISLSYALVAGLPGGSVVVDATLRGVAVGLSAAGLCAGLRRRGDARCTKGGR
jgi:hypothetical protein